ncbi:MAG: AAA family ATPase [Bacteroidales bacterium]
MRNLVERKEYSQKLLSYKDKDLIKVVTGLRRAGKSTLLELCRNSLLIGKVQPEQIQSYNFEFPENFLNKTWDILYFDIKFGQER